MMDAELLKSGIIVQDLLTVVRESLTYREFLATERAWYCEADPKQQAVLERRMDQLWFMFTKELRGIRWAILRSMPFCWPPSLVSSSWSGFGVGPLQRPVGSVRKALSLGPVGGGPGDLQRLYSPFLKGQFGSAPVSINRC